MSVDGQTLPAEDQNFVDSLLSSQEGDPAPQPTDGPPADDPAQGSTEPQDGNKQDPDDDGDIDALLGDDSKNANKAFASMRVKNKQLTDIINNVAAVIGLDPTKMAPKELEAAMNQAVIEAQSQQTQIPTEILERLNYLENQNKEREAEKLHSAARNGILAIKEQYGASKDELTEFLSNLAQDGIDPLHTQVDLTTEYVKRNFDKVVAARVETQVAAELERREKAQSSASTPSASKGSSPGDGNKISSVKEFERMLDTMDL